MKKVVLIALVLVGLKGFSQELPKEKDYSLARVGSKIQGVYMFIRTEPFYKYKYIATVKGSIDFNHLEISIDKLIARAKKKYPYFNGIIFHGSIVGKVDLIQFGDEEMSRGGFVLGQKVTFMRRINTVKTFFDGVIVELESKTDKASVQYKLENGTTKIIKLFYGDINPRK